MEIYVLYEEISTLYNGVIKRDFHLLSFELMNSKVLNENLNKICRIVKYYLSFPCPLVYVEILFLWIFFVRFVERIRVN